MKVEVNQLVKAKGIDSKILWYKVETNGSKMIKFGENHPKLGATCCLHCDQGMIK